MKITTRQLKRIIKEAILLEYGYEPDLDDGFGNYQGDPGYTQMADGDPPAGIQEVVNDIWGDLSVAQQEAPEPPTIDMVKQMNKGWTPPYSERILDQAYPHFAAEFIKYR